MESLDEALTKRGTFRHVWALIDPQDEVYRSNESYNRCVAYWNALSLQRQRQIYWALREQKRRGEPFKENPYYVISDCVPIPTNWNGRRGVNDLMKSQTKMVSAKYKASAKYGIYTLFEAQLFEMTDIKPLNYNLDKY